MTQQQNNNNLARNFLAKAMEAEQQTLAQGVLLGGQAGMMDGYNQGVADAASPKNINRKINQFKQGIVSSISSGPSNVGGQ